MVLAWLQLVASILWEYVMPIVGVLAVAVFAFYKFAHRIPLQGVRVRVGSRLVGRGSRIIGRTLAAVVDDDNIATLAPATYDEENDGYWIDYGDAVEFYSAEGRGGEPAMWYGGTTIGFSYKGLGQFADLRSGVVGSQTAVKMQNTENPHEGGPLASAARDLLGKWYPERDDPLADGGEHLLDEWEVTLPEKAVVDLRDTIHAAPFGVRPQQFARVKANAEAGARGLGTLSPLAQGGLLLGAVMLGAIATYLGTNSSGEGGGGGISLPLGGGPGTIAVDPAIVDALLTLAVGVV